MANPYFTLFGIDSWSALSQAVNLFEGFTFGDRWNGFATPLFTKDVAERVMQWIYGNPGSKNLGYDAEQDAFVGLLEGNYSDIDNPTEDEIDVWLGEDIVVEGRTIRVYAIGSWCWVWDEMADYGDEIAQCPTCNYYYFCEGGHEYVNCPHCGQALHPVKVLQADYQHNDYKGTLYALPYPFEDEDPHQPITVGCPACYYGKTRGYEVPDETITLQ